MRSLSVILLILLFSCKREETSSIMDQLNYFPVDSGHWVVYKVDSVYFDVPAGRRDTYSFFLKESFAGSYLDNEDRTTILLHRLISDDLNSDFEMKDVWAINVLGRSIEVVEENNRFIKLSFPLRRGGNWKGNSYIDTDKTDNSYLEDWTYEVSDIDIPVTIDSLIYDSCVTVEQGNISSDHFWYYGEEIYSKHIGLISKKRYNLRSNSSVKFADWMDSVQFGWMVEYKAVDFKK